MEREDLSSKLAQISFEGPFPSLPDLLYKTTGFYRFSDSSGNRKKVQENGKSLFSGQSRIESAPCSLPVSILRFFLLTT